MTLSVYDVDEDDNDVDEDDVGAAAAAAAAAAADAIEMITARVKTQCTDILPPSALSSLNQLR